MRAHDRLPIAALQTICIIVIDIWVKMSVQCEIFRIISVSLGTILFSVLTRGDKCVRFPVNCTGPFTISATSQPCPVDSVLLNECITRCMSSYCCRAGGVQQGKCIFNSRQDNSLHFIKTVPDYVQPCAEGKILK